jgi:hypothetical protein
MLKTYLIAAVVAGAVVAGCAQASEEMIGANWTGPAQTPETKSVYPIRAEVHQTAGRVALDCALQPAGQLTDCKVKGERPSGWGFGAAALKLYSGVTVRMSQADLIAAHADENHGRITMPVTFCLDDVSCGQMQAAWRKSGMPEVLLADLSHSKP